MKNLIQGIKQLNKEDRIEKVLEERKEEFKKKFVGEFFSSRGFFWWENEKEPPEAGEVWEWLEKTLKEELQAERERIIKMIEGLQEFNNGKYSKYNKGLHDSIDIIKQIKRL